MHHRSPRRGIRALALAFLTLTATLAALGCGKDGGGLTDPAPSDPGPSNPGPGPGPQGPAPVGDVIYAVDLNNNFLVFGSGSIEQLTAKMKIKGLPIFKRILGIAIRSSDGALIGVGNDSRVYTIDPLTAQATPIGSGPFSPKIVDFFEIHFAMAVEPNGQRIRLISAESGGNWSIDMTDGTATTGEKAHYPAGSTLSGTPALLGLVYPTLPDSAKGPGWCENLAYAIDSDEAVVVASCDPDGGEWWPAGVSPEASVRARPTAGLRQASVTASETKDLRELKDQLLRCGEVWPSPEGLSSDGEPRPPAVGEPFFPAMPDGPLWVIASEAGRKMNRVGTVTLISAEDVGIHWIHEVPSESPIQAALFAEGGLYGPTPKPLKEGFLQEAELSAAGAAQVVPGTPSAPASEPVAQCSGGSAR